MLLVVLGGFLMALADSVPGVSGGTIAFLMGIYDDFINSLNDIASRDKEKRIKAFKFLIKLGLGWITGFCSAVLVITAVFEKNIYEISSLFLGFVLFAIPLIFVEEKKAFKGKYYNAVWALVGAGIVVAITYFSGGANNISLAWGGFDVVGGILLFVGAMFAISAMVLPGISGSTILLVFGVYQPVMDAIHGFLNMEFKYVVGLSIFGFGMIAGVFTTIKGLKVALEKARTATLYTIVGMMLGSLYSIVMGPTNLDTPKAALNMDTFNVVFFIIGGAVIFGLQALKHVFAKKEEGNA